MKVTINSKPAETQATTVGQLADELHLDARGVAVAVDNRIVPRDSWPTAVLAEGADIVIVKAFCGG